MPEIEIRPAVTPDLNTLVEIDHSCQTEYVWQMDRIFEVGQLAVNFREIRLPHAIQVEYPHSTDQILENWKNATAILLASLAGEPVGYISLKDRLDSRSVWVLDLAVSEHHRRQGIATALLLSAEDWATRRRLRRIVLEMQSKNAAATRLALKLGFEFCGYNDQFYANQDIALFFSCLLR